MLPPQLCIALVTAHFLSFLSHKCSLIVQFYVLALFHALYQCVPSLTPRDSLDKFERDPLVGDGEMRWMFADSPLWLENYQAGPNECFVCVCVCVCVCE